MNHLRLLVVIVVIACVACVGTARAGRLYSVTPIPKGPYEDVAGRALNDKGHVVGIAIPSGVLPAVGIFWSPETGLLPLAGEEVVPQAMNNQDVVTGWWRSPQAQGRRAFVWDLQSRAGRDVGEFTFSTDVNEAGQLALRITSGPQTLANFVRNVDGTFRNLRDLPGTTRGAIGRLNNNGDAVGSAFFTDESETHAVYWPAAGGVSRLPDLPGLGSATPFDVNGSGRAVGRGSTGPDPGGSPLRGLVWDVAAGTVGELKPLPGDPESWAVAVNEAGDVVGVSRREGLDTRAVLWAEGADAALDLNAVLDASGRGWLLRTSNAINDRGQILVWGTFNGVPGTALLTPVPEPAAAALFATAAAGLLRRRRR